MLPFMDCVLTDKPNVSLGKIESCIGHARKNVNNVDRNKPLPFKGLNIRILSIILLKGRGDY